MQQQQQPPMYNQVLPGMAQQQQQQPPMYNQGMAQPGVPQQAGVPMAVMMQPGGGDKKILGAVDGHRSWTSELMGCCDTCTTMHLLGPCILCTVTARLKENPITAWLVPGGAIALRTKLRTLGGIKGSVCGDCIAMSFCGPCAVCQMERELGDMGL